MDYFRMYIAEPPDYIGTIKIWLCYIHTYIPCILKTLLMFNDDYDSARLMLRTMVYKPIKNLRYLTS